MFSYPYARPALTVDCVIFTVDFRERKLKVLLVQRGEDPFQGKWALPGGFVRIDETIEVAACRELREETGLDDVFMEQLCTYGGLDRDPRERVVSVAYFALVSGDGRALKASTDTVDAAWFEAGACPELAFDHRQILEDALARLRGKLRYQPVGFELLPDLFTLGELQDLYQIILNREFDKRNFRKKLESLDVLSDSGQMQQDVSHRAARLFRFDRGKYLEKCRRGFFFEL